MMWRDDLGERLRRVTKVTEIARENLAVAVRKLGQKATARQDKRNRGRDEAAEVS
jgi:signal recognition particle subunit SEC65